jgi:hypothetical protein
MIIFCFIICIFSCIRNISKSEQKVSSAITYFDIDKLGKIYTISGQQKVVSFDDVKQRFYEFNDNRLGELTSLDASNPLSIMIYFKNQGVIKLLDNTLSEIKSINLYKDGKFNFITNICLSNDNNFWIYEEQLQRLFKIDANLNILIETNFMKDLGVKNISPIFLKERGNSLVLASAEQALIFDNFGQFIKTFSLENARCIDLSTDLLYYIGKNGLTKQNIRSPDYSTTSLEQVNTIKQIRVENGKLYYNDGSGIGVLDY